MGVSNTNMAFSIYYLCDSLMVNIHVLHPHQRTMLQAREAVQVFSTKLEAKLGVKSVWNDDVLILERQGVKGTMALTEGVVEVKLTLGLMLTPMKGQIEAEVNKQLTRCLG